MQGPDTEVAHFAQATIARPILVATSFAIGVRVGTWRRGCSWHNLLDRSKGRQVLPWVGLSREGAASTMSAIRAAGIGESSGPPLVGRVFATRGLTSWPPMRGCRPVVIEDCMQSSIATGGATVAIRWTWNSAAESLRRLLTLPRLARAPQARDRLTFALTPPGRLRRAMHPSDASTRNPSRGAGVRRLGSAGVDGARLGLAALRSAGVDASRACFRRRPRAVPPPPRRPRKSGPRGRRRLGSGAR